MSIHFYMPTKLSIGKNSVQKGAADMAGLGKKALVVTGRNSARACGALDDALAALREVGVDHVLFEEVGQNPRLSTCLTAAEIAARQNVDFVLGIGGGSPLDAAKAIAVLAANPGLGGPGLYAGAWPVPALPVALIGTTSGTGSEVTPYAVITDDLGDGKKKGIGAPHCFAALAFGDAKYTRGLPYSITISTALDALTHAVEGYFNTLASPLTDLFALPAIESIADTLLAIEGKAPEAITHEQREMLYLASIYAGVVITHNRTSYCHSLGYFLTEEHGVPHGMACAVLLPGFIERAAALRLDRAHLLEEYTGLSPAALCEITRRLTVAPAVHLSPEAITEMAARFKDSANFKVAYDNFGETEAVATLERLFS